jgi:hypothetical protein
MKKYFISILSLIFLISFFSCLREDNPSINKAVWSSSDPLDIPVKRRLNEYSDKNKVFNPSFENGRYFRDNPEAYEIDGWKEIGESDNEIEWVSLSNPKYSKNEVLSGTHAIKITNNQIIETEVQGVGVMSDYIKVIPGNYSLSYFIKLKNICPYKKRFGNRLMDAINIRVYYYDKNKIQISGEMINPENGTIFDNEFKAFQFSGFWQIDHLDWTEARGISHKFPFLDGDIPNEARYVRLFFGLKGTGTMWLDNIRLNYTSNNFSLDERLKEYKDHVFQPHELIIPRPQVVKPVEDIKMYNPENPDIQPLIVIPENPGSITRNSAELLREKLIAISKRMKLQKEFSIPILTGLPMDKESEYSIIFSIGDNDINKRSKMVFPDSLASGSNQGYYIHRLKDTTNLIALKGNEEVGNYYAVQTICQLFADSSFNYYHAEIVDYPDYENRGIYINPEIKDFDSNLKEIERLRFNKAFLDANMTESYRDYIQNVKQLDQNIKEKSILKKGISANPYLPPFNQSDSFTTQLNSYEMKELSRYLQGAAQGSVSEVIIRMDDVFEVKDSCNCIYEFNRPVVNHLPYRSLIDRHTDLINNIHEWIPSNTGIYVLPVWYRTDCITKSQGRGELYLKEVFKKVPGKVNYLWTGATERPLVTDNVEVKRIEKIAGKKPVFFCKDLNPFSSENDKNTIKEFMPGKLRISSIFDHFQLDLPLDFNNAFRHKTFISEASPDDIFENIKLATLANYLWNSKDYNADYSLLRVLTSYFNKEKAFALIEFNELYYGIYEMCLKIEKQGKKKKFIRVAEEYLNRMKTLLDQIPKQFDIPEIQQELVWRKNEVTNLYKQCLK